MSCGIGGFSDRKPMSVLASLITAINLDEEFAERFRRDFIGPKVAIGRTVYERAQARGEIRADLDIDLVAPALAGMVLHRTFLLGEPATPDADHRPDRPDHPPCLPPAGPRPPRREGNVVTDIDRTTPTAGAAVAGPPPARAQPRAGPSS